MRGSCLCGGVKFEAADPSGFRNCHCSRCRKSRGGAFASNLFVAPENFRWLSGRDQVMTYRLPGAQRFGNAFCRVCGGPVPREVPVLNVMLIPAGILDDDPGVRPAYHIFVGSKAPWHEITDELPRYDEYRPEPARS